MGEKKEMPLVFVFCYLMCDTTMAQLAQVFCKVDFVENVLSIQSGEKSLIVLYLIDIFFVSKAMDFSEQDIIQLHMLYDCKAPDSKRFRWFMKFSNE